MVLKKLSYLHTDTFLKEFIYLQNVNAVYNLNYET